jgi:lipopolysaccharide export system protein LptA
MKNINRKSNITAITAAIVAALLIVPATTSAEKADRRQEIVIDAATNRADQAKNVLVLEGNVSLTQGTMRITADKMILKRDEQEYIFAELLAASGNQITFREKREGFDDFMEGTADRAEFDDKAKTIKLFNRAKLKTGTDTLTGEYIYYNSETEVIQADGRAPTGKDGKPQATDSSGRVRIVIQPRAEDKDKTKAPAAAVKADEKKK